MKPNEAPEKIYLIRNISTPTSLNTTNDCREKYLQEWYKEREKDTDIEYIKKDAFIEKVYKWLKNYAFVDNNKSVNLPILLHDFLKDSRKF